MVKQNAIDFAIRAPQSTIPSCLAYNKSVFEGFDENRFLEKTRRFARIAESLLKKGLKPIKVHCLHMKLIHSEELECRGKNARLELWQERKIERNEKFKKFELACKNLKK